MIARLLMLMLRAYQLSFSAILGGQCRFHPHCSAYAMQAIQTFGARKGARLAISRIIRCNPWHPGGHDPVPETLFLPAK